MKAIFAMLLVTPLISSLPIVASAQVNKCLDASGKVVGYGSECPAGTRSEQTNIKNAPAPAAAGSQKSVAERDADFRKRQMEKQEAAAKADQKGAEAAQRKSACENSRSYLKQLQDRQRITKTDPKTGERIFLADAEYPKEIAAAERSVAQNCK
jgi:hypothetical protein